MFGHELKPSEEKKSLEVVEVSLSNWGNPAQAQGEHGNSTKEGVTILGLSLCKHFRNYW